MGGLAGFMLAQIVQAGKWFIDWCQRPYLVIEDHNDCLILSHSDEQANGERYEEKRYGFYVRNRGRSIATGVQFQLIKIEHKPDPTAGFSTASEQTWHLP